MWQSLYESQARTVWVLLALDLALFLFDVFLYGSLLTVHADERAPVQFIVNENFTLNGTAAWMITPLHPTRFGVQVQSKDKTLAGGDVLTCESASEVVAHAKDEKGEFTVSLLVLHCKNGLKLTIVGPEFAQ